MSTQFDRLIATLCDEGVEFIIVGGFEGLREESEGQPE